MVDFPARGQKAPQYWDEQLKGYIDQGDASKADAAATQTALDSKASTAALAGKADASALAAKADLTAMNAGLASKADAAAMNTALAAKADATATTTALNARVLTTTYTAGLAAKADASALAAKANQSDLDALNAEVDALAAAQVDYARAAPGATFTVSWDGTKYVIGNTTITARPSSRTDIRFIASGGPVAVRPTWLLTYDIHDTDMP